MNRCASMARGIGLIWEVCRWILQCWHRRNVFRLVGPECGGVVRNPVLPLDSPHRECPRHHVLFGIVFVYAGSGDAEEAESR